MRIRIFHFFVNRFKSWQKASRWILPGSHEFNPWVWLQWKEKQRYKCKITFKKWINWSEIFQGTDNETSIVSVIILYLLRLVGWVLWHINPCGLSNVKSCLHAHTHTHTHTHLNKSWRQHPTKQQLYGHLPPITKTIKVRWTRHARHYWRSRDELISDVLLWTPSHGRAKAGWPARTYIKQLCEDTGCSPGDLPEAMNDWEGWRELVRDIRAGGTTWWWWYIY